MRVCFLLLIANFLFNKVLLSYALFEPSGLTHRKSTWHYKNEHYKDFIYNYEVVFRVLDRYVPNVSCLIAEAKRVGGKIALNDISDLFFNTTEWIKKTIVVIPKDIQENTMIIDPSTLILKKRHNNGNDTYHIFCDIDELDIEINKSVFLTMEMAKNLAIKNNQSLKINLSELLKKNYDPQNCARAIPKLDYSTQCIICLDNIKEIMIEPCNHLCMCEKCAKKVTKECPMCQGKIAHKKKVYF
jgi:hypothetical protein